MMKPYRRRIASLVLAATMAFSLLPAIQQPAEAAGGTMLTSPFSKNTMGSERFRIPVLLESLDGSKLYASADVRWTGRGDSPGNLDTIFAYSTDKGQNWTHTMVNHFVDHKDGFNYSNKESNKGSLTSASFIDSAMVEKDGTLYLLAGAVPAYTGLAGWWNDGAIKDAKGVGYDTQGNVLLYKGTPGDRPSVYESEYTYYADQADSTTDGKGTRLFPIKEKGTEIFQDAYIDAEFNLYDQSKAPVMCRQYDGDKNLTQEQVHCNVFYAQSEWKVFPSWHLWLRTSTNQGKTWSEPVILNHMVKERGEGFLGVSPGRGLVTKTGQIIFPVYDNSTGKERASVIYSDDGVNWHRGQRATQSKYGQTSSESQLIQLDDNTLRMFSRGAQKADPIWYTDSTNNGESWGRYMQTRLAYDGQCMTSFIRLNGFQYQGKPVVVGALPEQSRRHHGAIRMGYIEDKDITWLDDKIQVTGSSKEQSFAYSCLADMGNGEVALLYESNEPMGVLELEKFDLKPYFLKDSICADGSILNMGDNSSYSLNLRTKPYAMSLYRNSSVTWSLNPKDADTAEITPDGQLTTKAAGTITLYANNRSFSIEIVGQSYTLTTQPGQSTLHFQSGVDDLANPTQVKQGAAVWFKVVPKPDYRVEKVVYTVNGGSEMPLSADEEGDYTIPAEQITGPVTITVTTASSLPVQPEYTIDYTAETLRFDAAGLEVNTKQDFQGQAVQAGDSVADYIGQSLYIRKKADGSSSAGAAVEIALPARPQAPAPQGENTSADGQNDGKITQVTADMEYKNSSGGTPNNWTDCAGDEVSDLPAGTYLVRTKATGKSFAGETATVTVGVGVVPAATLHVTAPSFSSISYGDAQPAAQAITIENTGDSDVSITSVTVSGSDFIIGGSGDTVAQGGKLESWTVQPAAGLSAGSHRATIMVTTDSGASVGAEVSLYVNAVWQGPPAQAPRAVSVSYSSVELEPVEANSNGAKAQYSKDNGATWQDSPSFTGLSENTSYYFVIRYAASGNYGASDKSPAVVITTASMPSGGGSGGSGDREDHEGYRPLVKPEENKKPETASPGIVTKPDGTVVKTVERPDGSSTVVESKKDGTVTTTEKDGKGNMTQEVKRTDGSTQTTETRRDGTRVESSTDAQGRTSARVTLPAAGRAVEVTIPRPARPSAGEVLLLVRPDGTEEVVRKTGFSQEGLRFRTAEDAQVKVEYRGKQFADVPAGHWSEDAVSFVTARELFNGVSDSAFAPDRGMTRGMLVKVLHNLENNPERAYQPAFADVTSDTWCAESIQWATENGIVSGYKNGQFGPNDAITREQLAVILYRYMGMPAHSYAELTFVDADQLNAFAKEAMMWAVEAGIISGKSDNCLHPQDTATRVQVATMLMRLVGQSAQ